jgi:hypothetical protein
LVFALNPVLKISTLLVMIRLFTLKKYDENCAFQNIKG